MDQNLYHFSYALLKGKHRLLVLSVGFAFNLELISEVSRHLGYSMMYLTTETEASYKLQR